jgi:hypothetical protein
VIGEWIHVWLFSLVFERKTAVFKWRKKKTEIEEREMCLPKQKSELGRTLPSLREGNSAV